MLQDRSGLQRGGMNYHYENMKATLDQIEMAPEQLHFDDGRSELNPAPLFNWRSIYGYAAGKLSP